MKLETLLAPFRSVWRSSYHKRLLLSLLTVGFVLLNCFSFLLLKTAGDRYTEDLHELSRDSIAQAENLNRELLLNVFSFGLQSMENDRGLIRLMYGESYTPQDAVSANLYINELQKYNSFLTPIYIINFSTSTVLTSDAGRVGFSAFPNQSLLRLVQEAPVSSVPIRYTPMKIRVKSGTRYEERLAWCLIFHASPKGALVLCVDYASYAALLPVAGEGTSIQNYIFNDHGQILACSDMSRFGEDWRGEPLYEAMMRQKPGEGSFVWHGAQGKRTEVNYIQNALLGFSYLSVVEQGAFGLQNQLFVRVLSYSLLFLAASVLLAVVLAWRNYTPVQRLRSAIGDDAAASEEKDEFRRMTHIYSSIQQKNALLERDADAHHRFLRQATLLKLLDPASISQKIPPQQYQALEEHFVALHYCCVMVSFEDTPGVTSQTSELEILKYSTGNMMEELCQGHYYVLSAECSVNALVYVCNFDRWDRGEMDGILQVLCNVLQKRFQARPFFAVSPVAEDLEDLPDCYRAARELANRRFLLDGRPVAYCDDLRLPDPAEVQYPEAEEAQLVRAMRAGNAAEAQKQLEDFMARLACYPVENIAAYLMQLDLCYRKQEASYQMTPGGLDMNLLYNAPLRLSSVAQQFRQRTVQLCATATTIRESNSEKLVQRVNELIEEHLCDPNLSIASIADQVGLSVNYLRSVYKEAAGLSLSGYITQKKLELICELLRHSDLSIQAISEKLGFTTRNYFFTFFKKNMGMTPKQYRLMQGNPLD